MTFILASKHVGSFLIALPNSLPPPSLLAVAPSKVTPCSHHLSHIPRTSTSLVIRGRAMLHCQHNIYPFVLSPLPNHTNISHFADDLLLLSPCHLRLQLRFKKVLRYCLQISPKPWQIRPRYYVNDSQINSSHLTAYKQFLFSPTSAYKYHGLHFTFNLDFRHHLVTDLILSIKRLASRLIMASLPPLLALSTLQNVLRPKITYSFCITPFSLSDTRTLDDVLIETTRIIMALLAGRSGKCVDFPSRMIL